MTNMQESAWTTLAYWGIPTFAWEGTWKATRNLSQNSQRLGVTSNPGHLNMRQSVNQ